MKDQSCSIMLNKNTYSQRGFIQAIILQVFTENGYGENNRSHT